MKEKIDYYDPVLEDSIRVFLTYGYRKTSLDEIAKESGYSRQTIYQRYGSKEGLFKYSILSFFERAIDKANEILESDSSLENKLYHALDALGGEFTKHVMLSDHIGEIINESNRIVGDIIHDKHEAFIKVIKKMIIAEYSTKVLKQNGINAKNLTDTIYFAYKGVTIISEDQTAYQKNLKRAINTILKPIKA